MKSFIFFKWFLLSISLIILIGCGQSSNKPEWTEQKTELKEGVNVISDDPKNGLKGAIVEKDLVVYFEARRGEKNDREIDPSAPEYSVDARFLDDQGRTFSIVVGGDNVQDESWIESTENEKISADDRSEQFRLVSSLSQDKSLEKAIMKDSPLSPEWSQLQMLSNSIAQNKVTIDNSQSSKARMAATSTVWTHVIEAYKKPLDGVPGLLGGEHSATLTWQRYPDGRPYKFVITCNHGECANSSLMKFYGSRSYANRTTDIQSLVSSTHSLNGYCQTPYGKASTHHVCNDDTLVQMLFIKNNGGASYLFCKDNILAVRAPSFP